MAALSVVYGRNPGCQPRIADVRSCQPRIDFGILPPFGSGPLGIGTGESFLLKASRRRRTSLTSAGRSARGSRLSSRWTFATDNWSASVPTWIS